MKDTYEETSEIMVDNSVVFNKPDGSLVPIPSEQYAIAGSLAKKGEMIKINDVKYIVQNKFCDLTTDPRQYKVIIEPTTQEIPENNFELTMPHTRAPTLLNINDTFRHSFKPTITYKIVLIRYDKFTTQGFSIIYYSKQTN